jgi:S1-C subfamily serine protease
MKTRRGRCLLGGVLAATMGAGCATAPPTGSLVGVEPRLPPAIRVSDLAVDTVLYVGPDLASVGPRVGGHYDGLLKVFQSPNDLSAQVRSTWREWMQEEGNSLLRSAGYPVREASRVFGTVESMPGVGLVLAGEVTDLRFDTFGRLAGNQSEAALTIIWELLDVRSRTVVYSRRTSGRATMSGISGGPVVMAFRSSLSQVLVDPVLLEVLLEGAGEPRAPQVAQNDHEFRRVLPRPTEVIDLSSGMLHPAPGEGTFGVVAPAVVALRGRGGLGTAFVLTRDGLALTNHHVVHGERELLAVFQDGASLPARVLRSDERADVALIEIACLVDCHTVNVGRSGGLGVGSDISVIGTPLSEGLSHSMTRGILSGRRLVSGVTLLQTDAAVNQGNSGGPMIDPATNQVVGMVSSKLVGEGVEGLAFGIAIEDALRVVGISFSP